MNVGIIYLGSNNLTSLTSALRFLGVKFKIIKKTNNLNNFSHIILPGVGSYDFIINNFNKNFLKHVQKHIKQNKPILGICIGMQILGKSSTEGKMTGLKITNHKYIKLNSKKNIHRVPNTGYRQVFTDRSISILKEINFGEYFYFNHAYAFKYGKKKDKEEIVGYTNHNFKFVSIFQKKKIFGTQFHPEKSKGPGLKLISNFLEIK